MIALKSLRTRRALIMLLVLASVLILITVLAIRPKQSPSSTDAASPVVQKLSAAGSTPQPGLPVRIKIPKISVDGDVEHVGLTSRGDLAAPKAIESAGWYKQGPRPGQLGSAVIGGHFGLPNDQPAIFGNLHLLQKGDKIFIIDEAETTTTFVVTGSRSYDPTENAAAVFRSGPETIRLNLITCQGEWDSKQKTYASRLVIFTEKEQVEPRN